MRKIWKVYKHTSKTTGLSYIGVTAYGIHNRWHTGYDGKMKEAVDLYGEEDFVTEILDVFDNEKDGLEAEEYYIKKYNTIENGYNTKKGGDGYPKPVLCIETGEKFKSITDAAIAKHVDQSNLSKVCRGINQTTGGYHWQFIEKNELEVD